MNSTWEEKWEVVNKDKKSGGQGMVCKVRNKNNNTVGALKIMHSNNLNNTERRERMAREVYALEVIQKFNEINVPRIVEHNMEKVKDKSKELYMISEWIEGSTLTEYTQKNNVDVETALIITIEILNILKECHQCGISHRDIKPDNIIINKDENENKIKVYLIDFGIVYMDEDINNIKTEVGQELGNRFLRIPDYAPGITKRDFRSDITLTVGVLFYLITKQMPRVLMDENGNPPHIAHKNLIEKLDIDNRIRLALNNIFEIGFKVDKNLRFQEIEELEMKIMNILNPKILESINDDETVKAYKELINSHKYKEKEKIEQDILDVAKSLEDELEQLAIANELFSIHLSARATLTEQRDSAIFYYDLARSRQMTSPASKLYHTIQISKENSSYVEAKYSIDGNEEVIYYRGLVSDIDGLRGEVMQNSKKLFKNALEVLITKL